MVATLARNGTGYTVSNRRSFDPWGNVRMGATTGDPTGRYCANLGHVADDESGFVNMRARYYDVGNGRFISEDRNQDGYNWFLYCSGNPVYGVDISGNDLILESGEWGSIGCQTGWYCFGWYLVFGAIAAACTKGWSPAERIGATMALLAASSASFQMSLDCSSYKQWGKFYTQQFALFGDILLTIVGVLCATNNASRASQIAFIGTICAVVRDCQLIGALNGAIVGE
ncbi:MAG: RHS repeat-associated core domain-containing protein [Fimbriimonas sp.]